jgi:flagella basal body P-ring formation protein FlgA
MRQLLAAACVCLAAHAACVPVTGTRVFASDLARADSRFSALPSGLVAGFAPAPGTTRIFTATELTRFARANGASLDGPLADICFDFPVHPPTEESVIAAMRRSLPAGASLEVLSLSTNAVPAGDVHFPLDSLDGRHWRGFVSYNGNLRSAVWADVAISMDVTSVVAAVDLPQDIAIDAKSLRVAVAKTSNPRDISTLRIEDVVGLAPKTPIRAGAAIHHADLASPPAVRRGDSIRVEVTSGLAQLHFDVVAEAPARVGDILELRSPLNGKTFRARLDSPSKAVVIVGGNQKL